MVRYISAIKEPSRLRLLSDKAKRINGQRFIAVHWYKSLMQVADKAGVPITELNIRRMPTEPS